jgi:hypothetical protein
MPTDFPRNFTWQGSEGALKKIRVYERDPEEWNSANFLQGAGEVEALVRDSGAADTWPAPGSGFLVSSLLVCSGAQR